MSLNIDKLSKNNGYLEGPVESIIDAPNGRDYKRILSNMIRLISPEQIDSRLAGEQYYVSRKYDGMLQVVVYDGTHCFMSGTGGKVRAKLPCLKKVAEILKASGHKQFCGAAELYVTENGQRTRVYDVISALADKDKAENLSLAFFDILEIDNAPFVRTNPYEDAFNTLNEIFPKSGMVHIVETFLASSKNEVETLYKKLVEEDGAEGVVVRSDMPLVHKVKPFHTLDVAVVGYTESLKEDRLGTIKALLVAFMREDGTFQVAGRVGTGFDFDQRTELYNKLSPLVVDSNFIETDSDGIAFRMVKPEMIIEMRCCDIVTEISGKNTKNPILTLDEKGFSLEKQIPGIRLFFNVFVRERDDKKACFEDVRIAQVSELVLLPEENGETQSLPASEIIFRDVYTKVTKGKTMVQKFLVWKTNKETIDSKFPPYVMHYTNFSAGRKDPLKRELRVAGDEASIMKQVELLVAKNIKKGWNKVEA